MENRTKRDLKIFNLVSDFESMIATGQVAFLKEKSFQQIIDFYENELQIDKALRVVDYALSQYKYRSDFYIVKAKLLFRKQMLEECLKALDQAETVSPYESEIRILRARVFSAQGDMESAMGIIEDLKTYATKSDLVEIYICESYIHELVHNYEEMFQSLKKSLIIDPLNEIALERMWISVELSKNFEESILLHKVLLDKFPYNYLGWFNLGHAYACVGDYEDAINAIEYSFIINPQFEAGYFDCAEFCFQIKKYEQALEIYTEANSIYGPDSDLQVSIAHCQYLLDDFETAKINLQKALKFDPFNDEAIYLLANCYIKKENWGAALIAFKKAIKLDNEREEYYHGLARCFLHMGELNQAQIYYRKAAITGREQSLYWEEYISFLIQTGKYVQAGQIIEKAEQYTYSSKLLYCKSIVFFKQNKRKQAFKLLEEALMEDPGSHEFFFDLVPEFKSEQEIQSIINYFLGELKSTNG